VTKLPTHIADLLAKLHRTRPLVHHITNFVVMNDTANVTLHIGALPVMAHAREEVAEMVGLAGALLLNLGTPAPERIESMLLAGQRANELGVPVVLDPVGVGATTLRTKSAQQLLEQLDITIVRGNLGEVSTLVGLRAEVRGVESISGADPAEAARSMAHRWKLTAAVTGKRDIVSDEQRMIAVDNGHEWLTTVTGSGCMSTTMVAAFAAIESDPVLAATAGLACFGLAAELAAEQANGPASFKVALFDALYGLTEEQVQSMARVHLVTS
jgi:hydroxyethylthiazole kinase